MKIQCDVCDKDKASVFCVADEAALCDACDHRVHHANKLAGKHQRFSLLHPPPKQIPLCDICKERRAFLFCQQDRAILCRECDIPIHKANEHTQKHNRFLLTGVKLSANTSLYSEEEAAAAAASANSLANVSDAVPNLNTQNSLNKPVSGNPIIASPKTPNQRNIAKATTAITGTKTAAAGAAINGKVAINCQLMNGGDNTGPTSSISEYLMEMLPGWHVEDFLDPSSPFALCKSAGDSDMMPFWDADFHSNLSSSFSPESPGIWVPQAAASIYPTQTQSFSTPNMSFEGQISFEDLIDISNIKFNRKWNDDNAWAVPQVNKTFSSLQQEI